MKTATRAAILYALAVPINVWAGYKLGVEEYPFACGLVIVSMFIEYLSVKSWIQAQTEEVIKSGTHC